MEKNRAVCLIAAVAFGFVMLSFSPSLDGRARVAQAGELPQGMFAKTVGYLPGDSITVTNLSSAQAVDIMVVGSLDPTQGVAISLSPEAAAALGIEKGSDVMVKLTRREGMMDEVVSGSAVLSQSAETASAKESAAPLPPPAPAEREGYTEHDDAPVPNPPITDRTPKEPVVAALPEPVNEPVTEPPAQKPSIASEEKKPSVNPEPSPASPPPVAAVPPPVKETSASGAASKTPVKETPAILATETPAGAASKKAPVKETLAVPETGGEWQEAEPSYSETLVAKCEENKPVTEPQDDYTPFTESLAAKSEAEESAAAPEEETPCTESAVMPPPAEAEEMPPAKEEDVVIAEEDVLPPPEPEIEEPKREENLVIREEEAVPPPAPEPETENKIADTFTETDAEEESYAPIVLVPTEPKAPVAPEPKEEVAVSPEPETASGDEVDALTKPNLNALEKGAYYVQFATFADRTNMKEAVQKYSKDYPLVFVPSKKAMQALIGPLSVDEYGTVIARFKHDGFSDAFLRKMR